MFAVLMANPVTNFSGAPLLSMALIALLLGGSLLAERMAAHRVAAWTVMGLCVLASVFTIRVWFSALIYYWDHYWFWGCFC